MSAIQKMADNQSPGNDGFTVGFYRFFWPEIRKLLYNCYKANFENKCLSIGQKQAVMSLIPKNGKKLTQIKNWRPISLLNVDYKILTKILAEHIKNYLQKLILFPVDILAQISKKSLLFRNTVTNITQKPH